MDLFVPGSGDNGALEQAVDLQPGVNPNGLFWTTQIPDNAFIYNEKNGTATLRLNLYPLVETYQVFGPLANPGLVNIRLHWKATGEAVERGKGASVDPTDPASFLGLFRDARCTGRVEGYRPGLTFGSNRLVSDDFYASMGPMRNGSYL